MNSDLLKKIHSVELSKSMPEMEVGDTVNISNAIRDEKGEKRRTQDFKGIILSIDNVGISTTVTVRKVSHGVGVEKIFPIYSPNIEKIEILKKGRVRQSKIYYMRQRIGKKAMKIDESDKTIVQAEAPVEAAPTAENNEEAKND